MLEKTLQIAFELSNGKSATLSIKEPKSTITEQEVKAAIASILNQQVFKKGEDVYVSAKSAKLVERFVSTFEV